MIFTGILIIAAILIYVLRNIIINDIITEKNWARIEINLITIITVALGIIAVQQLNLDGQREKYQQKYSNYISIIENNKKIDDKTAGAIICYNNQVKASRKYKDNIFLKNFVSPVAAEFLLIENKKEGLESIWCVFIYLLSECS